MNKSRLLQVSEAAELIEKVTGEPRFEVAQRIRDDWQYRGLVMFNSAGRKAPNIYPGEAFDCIDLVAEGIADEFKDQKLWRVDICILLDAFGYHPEIQAAILAELENPKKPAPKEKPAPDGASWQEQARAIADELHQRDYACGGHDSLTNLAERIALEMRKRKINGPRGPLRGTTILKEALQGGKWKRKNP